MKNKEEKKTYKSRFGGSSSVYYTYKAGHVTIPRIIFGGTLEQCQKYVEDYNKMSPEKYRCVLYVGDTKKLCERLTELYDKYGYSKES